MTAKKLEQIIPQTSIVVRRVLRMGDEFLCGICRVQHKNLNKARTCLNRCWYIIQHGPPFIPFRKLGKLEFACVYCMRSFPDHREAKTCADECSARLGLSDSLGPVAKVARPIRSWMIQPATTPGQTAMSEMERTLKQLDDAAAARAAANTKPIVAEPVVASAPVVTVSSSSPETADADASGDKERLKKAPRPPKDRTKKFERHGSKYVCIVCNEKYFTKDEVEACWDKHD